MKTQKMLHQTVFVSFLVITISIATADYTGTFYDANSQAAAPNPTTYEGGRWNALAYGSVTAESSTREGENAWKIVANSGNYAYYYKNLYDGTLTDADWVATVRLSVAFATSAPGGVMLKVSDGQSIWTLGFLLTSSSDNGWTYIQSNGTYAPQQPEDVNIMQTWKMVFNASTQTLKYYLDGIQVGPTLYRADVPNQTDSQYIRWGKQTTLAASTTAYWNYVKLDVIGKSLGLIVLASDHTPTEANAATELANYLTKATDKIWTVIDEAFYDDSDPAIFVGPTALAIANGVMPEGAETWAIKSVDEKLLINGGRPRGTLYGVYHFLEEVVGVRWWTPFDEYVPANIELQLNGLNDNGQPAFGYRDIYHGCGARPTPGDTMTKFLIHHRVNGMFTAAPSEWGGVYRYGPPYHVHTFGIYLPASEYFSSHPEYFSFIAGSRNPQNLCLTNQDVKTIIKSKLLANASTVINALNYDQQNHKLMFNLSPNDGAHACQCSSCNILDQAHGPSGALMSFINYIASEIKQEYPQIIIDTLAYGYSQVPLVNMDLTSNVAVRVSLINADQIRPLDHPNNSKIFDQLTQWSVDSNYPRIWEYGTNYSNWRGGFPNPALMYLSDNYQILFDLGYEGIFIEYEYMLETPFNDLKLYLHAKLMENPYQEIDLLINQFLDGYYEAGAPYIKNVLTNLKTTAENYSGFITYNSGPSDFGYLDDTFLLYAHQQFDSAEQAVSHSPRLLKRVRFARFGIDLATVARWQKITQKCTGWLKRAETGIENILDRQAIADRAIQSYVTIATDRYGQEHASVLSAPIIANLECALQRPDVQRLPNDISMLPCACVVDYAADDFRIWSGSHPIAVENDLDSMTGRAAVLRFEDMSDTVRSGYTYSEGASLRLGVFTPQGQISGKYVDLKGQELENSGFHLYKLSNVKVLPSMYFYMFHTWAIQVDLGHLLTHYSDDITWDIYVSIKLEGPALPGGNVGDPGRIYVDRIVAISCWQENVELYDADSNTVAPLPNSYDGGEWDLQQIGNPSTQAIKAGNINILRLQSDSSSHCYYQKQLNPNFLIDTDWFLTARIDVEHATDDVGSFIIKVDDGISIWSLGFVRDLGKNGWAYLVSENTYSTVEDADISSLHSWQVVYRASSQTLEYYLNGIKVGPKLKRENVPASSGIEHISWGQMLTPAYASVDINYISLELGYPMCGYPSNPYPTGDINHDCRVDLEDLSTIATQWLKENL